MSTTDPGPRPTAPTGAAFLDDLAGSVRGAFEADRHILSFADYLDLVGRQPQRHARSAPQYLLDAIEHWGRDEVQRGDGTQTRWKVFDMPFDEGEDRVVGNERVQNDLVRVLRSFTQQRRVNRLILIHGPNGSAKSSLIATLFRALEAYSRTADGAIYRFNWVFPTRRLEAGRIGFGARPGGGLSDSYAYLDDSQIDARLVSEHNDHPLFLLAPDARVRFLEAHLAEPTDNFVLSDVLRRGDLGPRSRAVFDALLTSYKGDLAQVLRHVQIERWFIARRYRRGAVTIEPQLRVDAGVRAISADRSLAALPTALQSQTLFETFGPLAEGNRGVIEYNDLLKRPLEANKYLLSTSEKGTVALDVGEMLLDAVLIGTGNETYLEAFKQQADWASYKGRIELIRMPYLLDWRAEQAIYDDTIRQLRLGDRVAPHSSFVAGLWAVLTRLGRPDVERYPAEIRPLIEKLTPLDKAMLYADGTMPAGLDARAQAALRRAIPELLREGEEGPHYEGRYGASAREIKAMINAAAQGKDARVSPLRLFREFHALVRDPSLFEWLRIEPRGDYHRPDHFILVVRQAYLERVMKDLRTAAGFVDEDEYLRLFEHYIQHANHWLRNEKIRDPRTGREATADERMMEDVENRLGRREDPREWRSHLISRIAAFRIDNPDGEMDLQAIFPRHIETLREQYYASKRAQLDDRIRVILALLDGDTARFEKPALDAARATLEHLRTQRGYADWSVREALGLVLSNGAESAK